MQLWQQFNLQETIKHSAEEFTLRYRTPVGGWVELFDEQQILYVCIFCSMDLITTINIINPPV
jgi:hypothetical protein